jgi:hypothetical protein
MIEHDDRRCSIASATRTKAKRKTKAKHKKTSPTEANSSCDSPIMPHKALSY